MRKIGLFLIFFVLGIYNIAFGYNYQDFLNFTVQTATEVDSSNWNQNAAAFYLLRQSTIENEIANRGVDVNSYNNFIARVSYTTSGGIRYYYYYYYFFNYLTNGTISITNSVCNIANTSGIYLNYKVREVYNGSYELWSAGITSQNLPSIGYSKSGYYGLQTLPVSDYYQWRLENMYVEPFTFEFDDNYDYIIDGVNVLKRSYSVSSWTLGWIDSIDKVSKLQFDLIDNNYDYESPLYSSTYNGDLELISQKSNLYLAGNALEVPSRVISYNNKYKLNIYIYSGDTLLNTLTYNYKWLPVNAVISGDFSGDSSGGVIISTGSGDFNTQDSTNTIMDSSEVDDIINEYLSGDIEDLADDFGFTALDNPFTTFLFHILESTYDALTLREPVVLNATYNGMTFTLNSNDFITPDSGFKTFIRALLIFLYIYGNYKYFHYLITLVETAKIDKVINEIGTDEFNDSNIM